MPPKSTIVCCILVTIGFGYGVTPSAASPTNDRGNSKLGIIFGVLSAVMIAVHAILVKWSMRKVAIKDMDSTFVVKYVFYPIRNRSWGRFQVSARLTEGRLLSSFLSLAYLTNLGSAILLFPVLVSSRHMVSQDPFQ
jgi:hypothetical protein